MELPRGGRSGRDRGQHDERSGFTGVFELVGIARVFRRGRLSGAPLGGGHVYHGDGLSGVDDGSESLVERLVMDGQLEKGVAGGGCCRG